MLSFLNEWDNAIAKAQETGEAVTIYKQDHMLEEPRAIARTRHPSFMGGTPVKHDPKRDK